MPGDLSTVDRFLSVVRGSFDVVADAGHGRDEPWFAESLAQGGDGDAHRVGERICVLVPRLFEELLSTDDAPLGRDEDLQHGELLAGERDVAIVPVDLAAEGVQPETGDLAHGRSA